MSIQETFSEREEGFTPEISESETLWAADKREIKSVQLIPERQAWVIWSILRVTYNEWQQPNTSKLSTRGEKKKLINEIFIPTPDADSQVSELCERVRSPKELINSSGVRWLLVSSMWFWSLSGPSPLCIQLQVIIIIIISRKQPDYCILFIS
jgi:hypothetical protein